MPDNSPTDTEGRDMSASDVFKRLGCPLSGLYSWAGECFGVLVKATDERTLGPRSREWCDERDVRRLGLRCDGERIVVRIVAVVPLRDVAK
jgi:hypothetical protein